MEELFNVLINMCNAIVNKSDKRFSGLAIAFIDDDFDMNTRVSLRPNFVVPKLNLFKDEEKLIDYFVSKSIVGNIVHDGFHFIDKDFNLILSGQYFVPPPCDNLELNQNCGIRYHSGLFGSKLEGVKFIITISSNKSIYIFKDGEVVYKKLYFMEVDK